MTEYYCWCEQCEWNDVAPTQRSASYLINLGHGVPTGHHKTRMKPLEEAQSADKKLEDM